MYRKLGGTQGRSGRAENLAPTGIRSSDRPARSSVAIPTELPGPPLFFCIAPIPLINELNRADCGYPVHRTERKISQLFYMEDLKLLGRSKDELKNEIIIVKAINKDVNMNFGLENCAKICLKKGRA